MKKHNSQRGWFAHELYQQMKKNDKIWLITADLGYKMWDQHFEDFPDRCVNVGAAEQAMIGMAVGLALGGKKPFCYSITPFLLYRPYEWLRNYLYHENIPVRLIGAGRDKDYGQDGFTHWSEGASSLLDTLPNIFTYWPETKKAAKEACWEMVEINSPSFVSLKR